MTTPPACSAASRAARMFVPHAGKAVEQVGVAPRPEQQLANDEEGPALADQVERSGERTTLAVAARFIDTFQGTFVTITRNGDQVLGGFGEHGIITMLAIPAIAVCD